MSGVWQNHLHLPKVHTASQWSQLVLSCLSAPAVSSWIVIFISSHLISLLPSLMSAALDAAGPSAMFRRFFNSCLQKRPERSPSQPPHLEGSAETDSSDATLVPLQSTTHSPKFPTRDPITASPRERDEAQRRTPPSKSDTMPRAAKAKSTPKSAKDRKPSLRVQQATRSDSHITCCSHKHIVCCFPRITSY